MPTGLIPTSHGDRHGMWPWIVAACLTTCVSTMAGGQSPTTVRHAVTARVDPMTAVREVAPLAPVADSIGVLAGTVAVVSNAPFSVEVRLRNGTGALGAVRVPGGPWLAVGPDDWTTVTDLPHGQHVFALEYRVDLLPDDGTVPAPVVRAVPR